MQDEEFDQAFNSKFDDFEVEPSPMVWKGIADELDGKKSKRSLVAYLSIAASVIVLLAAGALFFQQQEKPTKHQADTNKLATNVTQPVTTVSPKSVTEPAITESTTKRIASTKNQATTSSAPAAINAGQPSTEKAENTPGDAEPVKRDNPQLIAAAVAPPRELQPVVPDKNVDLAIKSPNIDQQPAARPAIMASATKPDAAPAKKHGIHSLGGLINVLVAKVDKRQDKLIEFTDDEDDDTESNITGVNLGIIKIKKQ